MLCVRIIPHYTKIFTNWPGEYGNYVNFAADDAIFHMRLVHNTLHHFPWRVFFDPFTYFPYGSYTAFGPLFTFIIAGLALIIGFGSPSPELVNHVAAYIPPVMGALCLIPVYFITRKIFGKSAAILSAFILTFLPGEFLHRSALGFIDHHIAEVLFSTTACAFLIHALVSKNKRAALIYGLLCGTTFGLFFLIWQGAIMFGAIFLIFFITQLLIDHIRNNNTNYLLFLFSATCIPPLIILLPYASTIPFRLYPSNNIPILAIIIAIFSVCYLLHSVLKHKQLGRDLYPLALAAVFILIIFTLNKYSPQTSSLISYGCKLLFHPGIGMLTVSEMHPTIIGYDGKIAIRLFWDSYYWSMPLAIIGLCLLCYRAHKNQHPAEVFLLVWTLVIIASACAQLRFNYYLAINVAILAGYAFYFLFNLANYLAPKRKFYILVKKLGISVLFFFLAFLIIDPILLSLIDNQLPSGSSISHELYNTLIWLKTHTPDPQGKSINKNFDYTSGYYYIPKNLKLYYNYPKSAYGIMSWWDLGHQITYIAQRIPNANPYQQGIIDNSTTTGAALFFTSNDEEKATKNLNKIGTRYILITEEMATRKFQSMGLWSNDTSGWYDSTTVRLKLLKKTINAKVPIDSQKFLQSMISRLFYYDTNGLQHFRLIYEDEGSYNLQIKKVWLDKKDKHILNIRTKDIVLSFKNYDVALNATKKINNVYYERPPVKSIKVFEKVRGATISGKVPNNIANNTPIKLTLKLKTKYGRIFAYQQTTKLNHGKYSFVVPYPTTSMRAIDYSYDIEPIGNYQIQINNKITEVFVSEDAVMLGKNIQV